MTIKTTTRRALSHLIALRRKRVLSALLLTVAVGAIAPTAKADAAYVIKPAHSNKCLDIEWQSRLDGARMIQWTCNYQLNQQFSVEYTDSGYYKIVNLNSGKCIDVRDGSTADYATVWQWWCHGGNHQQFMLRYAVDGYYNIVARHSGKCLDVQGASTADRAPVIQHGCTGVGGRNQQFSFQWR